MRKEDKSFSLEVLGKMSFPAFFGSSGGGGGSGEEGEWGGRGEGVG